MVTFNEHPALPATATLPSCTPARTKESRAIWNRSDFQRSGGRVRQMLSLTDVKFVKDRQLAADRSVEASAGGQGRNHGCPVPRRTRSHTWIMPLLVLPTLISSASGFLPGASQRLTGWMPAPKLGLSRETNWAKKGGPFLEFTCPQKQAAPRRVYHSTVLRLRAQEQAPIGDDDILFLVAQEKDVDQKRKAKRRQSKSLPIKDSFFEEEAESTTAWDEPSELDGAFQTSLNPLVRKARPPSSSSPRRPDQPYSKEAKQLVSILEFPTAATVLLGCGVLAGQSLQDQGALGAALCEAEDVINMIFIAEYGLRWYSRNLEPRYLLKWEMVVDFLSFLPFLVEKIAMQRIPGLTFVRLLRVLRLQRYLRDIESFRSVAGPVAKDLRPYQLEVLRASASLMSALFITAGLVCAAEAPSNPNLSNYFQTFYFAVTTLTTVGFGDITPVTPAGKAVVIGAILVGAGVVPYQISKVAESLIEGFRVTLECPRCAEQSHPQGANFCWRCGNALPTSSKRFRPDLEPLVQESDDYFS